MFNEVTPSPEAQLASLKLTLLSCQKGLKTLEHQLRIQHHLALNPIGWLPVDMAAALCGLTPCRFRSWAKSQGLTFKEASKVIFFKADDIKAAIEKGKSKSGLAPQDVLEQTFNAHFAVVTGGKR